MLVEDVTGPTERQYMLAVPKTYDPSKKTPLLVYFHGQGDAWPPLDTNYHEIGEREGFISVYPRGYGDFGGTDDDANIAWNVGLNDIDIEAANDTCFEGTKGYCYDSCGQDCSRCMWSTCVDDVSFVTKLITDLTETYNIETKAIFVTGASNGGMMTHYYASQ